MTRPLLNAPADMTDAHRREVLTDSETAATGEELTYSGNESWLVIETDTDPEETPYDVAVVYDDADYCGQVREAVQGLGCNGEVEVEVEAGHGYVTEDFAEALRLYAQSFTEHDLNLHLSDPLNNGVRYVTIRRGCPHGGTC